MVVGTFGSKEEVITKIVLRPEKREDQDQKEMTEQSCRKLWNWNMGF